MKIELGLIKKYAVAVVLAAASVGASASVTIGFDDLKPTQKIEDGYAGFYWHNFYVANAANGEGYANGIVSGENVAFNAQGQRAQFYRETPFTLESLYLTRAWHDGYVTLNGFSGDLNNQVYTARVYLTTSGPTLLQLNWTNLLRVSINNDGHTAFENITVSMVPEPATYAMLLTGLGMAGLVVRRRKALKPQQC